MPITKNTKIKAKPPQTKGLQSKRKINKKIVALVTVVIAAIGALLLIFSHADVNGCTQLTDADKKVYSVCSVRFLRGRDDSILLKSGSSEITSLKAAGFDQLGGWDYGNIFRAPDGPYKGAVPIYRVFNAGASLHDFVTASQRDQKSAVWKASSYVNEGIAFYAYETQVPGTVPVYRSYHKGSTFTLYTTDLAQRNAQVAQDSNIVPGASDGLKYTGDIAFYAYPNLDCSKAENFYTAGCNDERTNLFTPPEAKKAAEDAAKAAAQAQIAATTTKTPEAKKAATVATTTAKKTQQTAAKSGQAGARQRAVVSSEPALPQCNTPVQKNPQKCKDLAKFYAIIAEQKANPERDKPTNANKKKIIDLNNQNKVSAKSCNVDKVLNNLSRARNQYAALATAIGASVTSKTDLNYIDKSINQINASLSNNDCVNARLVANSASGIIGSILNRLANLTNESTRVVHAGIIPIIVPSNKAVNKVISVEKKVLCYVSGSFFCR